MPQLLSVLSAAEQRHCFLVWGDAAVASSVSGVICYSKSIATTVAAVAFVPPEIEVLNLVAIEALYRF